MPSLSARRAWIEMQTADEIKTEVTVALRKESVDRNLPEKFAHTGHEMSLSARRAWIEIPAWQGDGSPPAVALRKESVDRNCHSGSASRQAVMSLSARRAWIEIVGWCGCLSTAPRRSPQGERG